jgi:hypothetical protein
MTIEEIRACFNKMIEAALAAGDAKAVARMEIAREYFTNPAFKRGLEDFTWAINQGR